MSFLRAGGFGDLGEAGNSENGGAAGEPVGYSNFRIIKHAPGGACF